MRCVDMLPATWLTTAASSPMLAEEDCAWLTLVQFLSGRYGPSVQLDFELSADGPQSKCGLNPPLTARLEFSLEISVMLGHVVFSAILFETGLQILCVCAVVSSCFGNINFFGGPSATSVKASAKLQQLESANDDAMFVFLSDVWLDDIKVLML